MRGLSGHGVTHVDRRDAVDAVGVVGAAAVAAADARQLAAAGVAHCRSMKSEGRGTEGVEQGATQMMGDESIDPGGSSPSSPQSEQLNLAMPSGLCCIVSGGVRLVNATSGHYHDGHCDGSP
jgi:hypothetical protein